MGAVSSFSFSLLTRVIATCMGETAQGEWGEKPGRGRARRRHGGAVGPATCQRLAWQLPGSGPRQMPYIVGQLMTPRAWLLAIMHAAVFGVGYWLAYLLRFDFAIPPDFMSIFWLTLCWVIGLKLLVFCLLGQFRGWWRYVTFADLTALFRAAALSLLVLARLNFFYSSRASRSRIRWSSWTAS